MNLSKIVRKCVGCNELVSCDKLFRICIIDGKPVIDKAHSLQSRAGYICKSEQCILKARKSKGLNRSLKKYVDESIYDTLINSL